MFELLMVLAFTSPPQTVPERVIDGMETFVKTADVASVKCVSQLMQATHEHRLAVHEFSEIRESRRLERQANNEKLASVIAQDCTNEQMAAQLVVPTFSNNMLYANVHTSNVNFFESLDEDQVEQLIARESDVPNPAGLEFTIDSPIMFDAVHASNLKFIELLIEKGFPLEIKSAYGDTLLMAAMDNDMEVIEYLVNEGLDVHAKEVGGHTAIWSAVYYCHFEAVDLLLQKGARVDELAVNGVSIVTHAMLSNCAGEVPYNNELIVAPEEPLSKDDK